MASTPIAWSSYQSLSIMLIVFLLTGSAYFIWRNVKEEMPMKTSTTIVLLVGCIGLFLLLGPTRVQVGGAETAKIDAAERVLTKSMNSPDGSIPEAVLRHAHAIAVIPNVFSESMLFKRGYGDGVLIARRDDGSWSSPAFVKFFSGEAQLDGKGDSTDVILVFNDNSSISTLEQGSLILGTDASVGRGPVQRALGEGDSSQKAVQVYSYSRNDGLIDGTSLFGSSLKINRQANESFYRDDGITLSSILSQEILKAPAAAGRIACAISKNADRMQVCSNLH
jgi:lipid-binding SYLF domain-containing protein